jgi:hypothetical protein
LQTRKKLESLAFVFLLGILLCVTAQMYPLSKIVKGGQMITPVVINRLQEHGFLKSSESFASRRIKLAGVSLISTGNKLRKQSLIVVTGCGTFELGNGVQIGAQDAMQGFIKKDLKLKVEQDITTSGRLIVNL